MTKNWTDTDIDKLKKEYNDKNTRIRDLSTAYVCTDEIIEKKLISANGVILPKLAVSLRYKNEETKTKPFKKLLDLNEYTTKEKIYKHFNDIMVMTRQKIKFRRMIGFDDIDDKTNIRKSKSFALLDVTLSGKYKIYGVIKLVGEANEKKILFGKTNIKLYEYSINVFVPKLLNEKLDDDMKCAILRILFGLLYEVRAEDNY
jgi:hypothetical protein